MKTSSFEGKLYHFEQTNLLFDDFLMMTSDGENVRKEEPQIPRQHLGDPTVQGTSVQDPIVQGTQLSRESNHYSSVYFHQITIWLQFCQIFLFEMRHIIINQSLSILKRQLREETRFVQLSP